jgi:hypothetical protein
MSGIPAAGMDDRIQMVVVPIDGYMIEPRMPMTGIIHKKKKRFNV